MRKLTTRTRALWLRFIRVLSAVFGYSVATEWQIDILHYDGCWHEWTTGMPSENSAIESMQKSQQEHDGRKFRVTDNITVWKSNR